MESELLIVVLSLIMSAFFSGMEIAFVSSNKIYLELEKKQGGLLGKILTKFTENPAKFITTMLIGNNLALVIYTLFMGAITMRWFQSFLPSNSSVINYAFAELSLLTQTIISTVIILLTAEFLPKVFFQIYANSLIKVFAYPAYFFYTLFTWISSFVLKLSDSILNVFFKEKNEDSSQALTKKELGYYLSEHLEALPEEEEVDSEIQIFKNALDFAQVKAREAMIPRTEIVGVDITDSIETLRSKFVDSGYTKIIVYKDNTDDILGYVHAYEMFKNPKNIKSILIPIGYVPETIAVKEVLNILMRKKRSMAVVIDEYGGTSGIMTIEDIIEELVGNIEDEHDTIDLVEEQLGTNTYLLSTRLEVDYLNNTYKLDLPENDQYETLGGLIVFYAEEIPQLNQTIEINNYIFKIKSAASNKLETVQLTVNQEN